VGTIKQHFAPEFALLRSATAFPQFVRADGTTGPVSGYAFDATTEETIYYRFRAGNYGSGNITITAAWYADTGTSGGIAIGVSLAAITANTDTQDVETKAFATETIITDTHLGTTGQRAHDVIGTLSNLDSLAVDDWVLMRIARKPADAGDTMSGDMILVMVDLSYSDT
jgi:hypothetical protein